MVIKNIDFEKYNKMAEKSFYRKLGKVVNVVGLTIESAGPDSKLGDLCRILPDAEGARPIMAEVVGFRDKKTLLMPYDSVDGIGLGCVVEKYRRCPEGHGKRQTAGQDGERTGRAY